MNLENLKNQFSDRIRNTSDEQDANAAVALLLKNGENINALFVKRVTNPRDPWSGQISLPGGKRDSKDKNLTDTVTRETLEETGIDIKHCDFLGTLSTRKSPTRPEVKVLPFVILLDHEPEMKLNRKELETHFWITTRDLGENKTSVKFSFGEQPAFVINHNIIWGLTYRIIEEFMNILQSAEREN